MATYSQILSTPPLSTEDHEGFKFIQSLAYDSAQVVAKHLQEGWTEQQAAKLMKSYLCDHGVKAFFHEPYAWFGTRTRFEGIQRKKYSQFNPTQRKLNEGDAVILDVAPLFDGYVGDIGFTTSLGPNPEVWQAKTFLREIRKSIPKFFKKSTQGGFEVWQAVDDMIKKQGYENIHKLYPFHVLGHRVRRVPFSNWSLKTPTAFSLHSFLQVLSDGLYPQLLSPSHKGNLNGFWAIEPHVGAKDFGAKFEEILVVEDDSVYWLDDEVPHAREK